MNPQILRRQITPMTDIVVFIEDSLPSFLEGYLDYIVVGEGLV